MVPLKSGLLPATHDRSFDFSHAKTFGATVDMLPGLPPLGLGRKPMPVTDQKNTSDCTGFSTALASSFQENVPLAPEFQVAAVSAVVGQPITYVGAQPIDAMKAATQFGSLEDAGKPYDFAIQGWNIPADMRNYTDAEKTAALVHRKQSYFAVTTDSGMDMYDAIRLALWQSRDENGVVCAFSPWYREFNTPIKGIVPLPAQPFVSRHAYTYIDWTVIDGKEYLVSQLTQGPGFGDNGLLYFDRATVNFVWSDMYHTGSCLYLFRDIDPADPNIVPVGFDWVNWIRSFLAHHGIQV